MSERDRFWLSWLKSAWVDTSEMTRKRQAVADNAEAVCIIRHKATV